jgi:uncharacterized protein with PQ loop repeat
MRLTIATVKLIGWVLSGIGIAIFVTQQYLAAFHPELAQNSLNIIALALLVFGCIIYAVATELIKRQNNSQSLKK